MTGSPACRWGSPTWATAGGAEETGVRAGRGGSAQLAGGAGAGLCRARGRAAAPAPHPCGPPKYGNDLDEVDLLLVQAYQSYIDELKGLHNTRFGRGPIGGTLLCGHLLHLGQRPLRRSRRHPDGRHAPHPAGGRGQPASGSGSPGADGGVQLPRQAAHGGHPRRRAAQQKLSQPALERTSGTRPKS